jgi:hypothetical protein
VTRKRGSGSGGGGSKAAGRPPAGGGRRGQPQGGRRSSPGPGDFWGRAAAGDALGEVEPIRPTPDPSTLSRSLGDPPLGPNPEAGQVLLAAVYDEAVRAATALAAASGLLDNLDPDDG